MVLNIFPRREKAVAVPAPEPEPVLPEPSPEALEDPKKRTRRGSRGGRGRRKPAEGELLATEPQEEAAPESAPAVTPEPPAARRVVRRSAAATAQEESSPESPAAPEEQPERAPRTRKPRAQAAVTPAPTTTDGDLKALTRAIEAQGKQLEQLVRIQEELARRIPAAGTPAGAVPARVGVFVDAANIELACDRLRSRINWKKLLDFLTEGRQLVRAIAYSPVHDDPGVSLETQRFAEPFLDKGFRVVTKPLKRFADGSIKANVDIEMALDIMEMLDRLDVVCLVSGDGDFQRLVEVVQMKGVRVEVVGVGTSTASQLRNAGDRFIDIQSILPKIKA